MRWRSAGIAASRDQLVERDGKARRELDAAIVEGVDQEDEALGGARIGAAETGNVVDHQRIVAMREAQIVARAERGVAEGREIEARGPHRSGGNGDFAPERNDRLRGRLGAAGELLPEPIHGALGFRTVPKAEHRLARELQLPVVCRAVEAHDLDLRFEQRDERQEELPVEAVAIELVGRGVRGGNEGHAAGKQFFEQPAEEHRVGDVLDLELVEAEEPRGCEDRLDDRGHRVVVLAFRGGAERCDPGMELVHELVEMRAALLRDRDGGIKEVHQHGLAAPDGADEVGAANRFGTMKEAMRLIQAIRDPVEDFGGGRLQRIGGQRAATGEVGKGGRDGGGTAGHGPAFSRARPRCHSRAGGNPESRAPMLPAPEFPPARE